MASAATSTGSKAEQSEADAAEQFFSTFRKGVPGNTPDRRTEPAESNGTVGSADDALGTSGASADVAPDENEFGEPPCAIPVDIGWSPQPNPTKSQDDFASRKDGDPAAPDTGTGTAQPKSETLSQTAPDGEAGWIILVEQIRKENLSLAATLAKAKEWNWSEGRLFLSFGSEYEASVTKNEADTIRRTASAAGMPPFTLEVTTTGEDEQPKEEVQSRRVELVRRVFRGQVMKG